MGGAPAFGHLVIGAVAKRNAASAPFALAAGKLLGEVGKAGFLALVISGPVMIWLQWSVMALTTAFWIKMALVLCLVVNIALANVAGAKAEGGDARAAARLGLHAAIGAALMVGLILSAVIAFR